MARMAQAPKNPVAGYPAPENTPAAAPPPRTQSHGASTSAQPPPISVGTA